MLVTVPTYRRHSNGEAQTFEHVPRDFALTLVVRAEEAQQYEKMLGDLRRHSDEIWAIPEGAVSGIATTRQWIVEEALRRGHDRLVMMDDDLHFIVRGRMSDPEDDVHLRPCDDQDFRDMVEWFDHALGFSKGPEHGCHGHNRPAFSHPGTYSHAAVSMREGNNREPGFGAHMVASRGIRVVGYDLRFFDPTQTNDPVSFRAAVEGREDLDMTLQLLRRGQPNIVTYHWAQGQRSAGAPGGLEGQRSAEQLDQTAELLAELHPGLVKTRVKLNKTGAMAGERTEVTIGWKKALKEGQCLA